MQLYENREETTTVEGNLFGMNFERETLPNIEEMERISSNSTFHEYVLRYSKRLGYGDSSEDNVALVSFLLQKCKEADVEISRNTLKNWLKNGLPANNELGRENVYRLCFALQMNANETKEFFLKAYLERPFNYKNITEAVYYFCLNSDRKYADAVSIISKIELLPTVDNPCADEITEEIGAVLEKIRDEEKLIRYININKSGFMIQNKTATDKIIELINSCKKIAPQEYAKNNIDEKPITVDNIDELLTVIYGYSARQTKYIEDEESGTKKSIRIFKKSISKSNFPDLIKRNWPQREQFQNIVDKRTASYDVIRKALIILDFYNFMADATVKNGLGNGIFDEFTNEMNSVLSECGYTQLYWRNPFDWMIGYCAIAPFPLDTFRELIEEFYLSDPTIINELVREFI